MECIEKHVYLRLLPNRLLDLMIKLTNPDRYPSVPDPKIAFP